MTDEPIQHAESVAGFPRYPGLLGAFRRARLERQDADDVVLIEETMQHHLGCPSPEGWVLCLCCETFEGPVFHRRHVASLIAAGEMCEPECRHPLHKMEGGADDD